MCIFGCPNQTEGTVTVGVPGMFCYAPLYHFRYVTTNKVPLHYTHSVPFRPVPCPYLESKTVLPHHAESTPFRPVPFRDTSAPPTPIARTIPLYHAIYTTSPPTSLTHNVKDVEVSFRVVWGSKTVQKGLPAWPKTHGFEGIRRLDNRFTHVSDNVNDSCLLLL